MVFRPRRVPIRGRRIRNQISYTLPVFQEGYYATHVIATKFSRIVEELGVKGEGMLDKVASDVCICGRSFAIPNGKVLGISNVYTLYGITDTNSL